MQLKGSQLDPRVRDGTSLAGSRRDATRAHIILQHRQHARQSRDPTHVGRTALVAEQRHRDLPSVAGRAEHVVGRHLGAVEKDLGELARAVRGHDLATLDTGCRQWNEQHRQRAVCRLIGLRAREQQTPLRPHRFAGPDLLSLDAIDHARRCLMTGRAGGDAREVAARVRFAETLTPTHG